MEITNVLVEVYDALEYLNTQAILHRDLKISNVLLHDGHCKLADFGFSIRSDKLFRDVPIGSPAYMSPEGLIGNLYGPKTDVWSFGLLIFELLTGKVPLTSCKTEE